MSLLFCSSLMLFSDLATEQQTFSRKVVSNSYGSMDCGLPGSSVHGISQARILEWVAIFFFRASSQPRIEPRSPAFRQILYYLSHQRNPIMRPLEHQ